MKLLISKPKRLVLFCQEKSYENWTETDFLQWSASYVRNLLFNDSSFDEEIFGGDHQPIESQLRIVKLLGQANQLAEIENGDSIVFSEFLMNVPLSGI